MSGMNRVNRHLLDLRNIRSEPISVGSTSLFIVITLSIVDVGSFYFSPWSPRHDSRKQDSASHIEEWSCFLLADNSPTTAEALDNPFTKANALCIYGDSIARYFFRSLISRGICERFFKKCIEAYMKINQVRNKNSCTKKSIGYKPAGPPLSLPPKPFYL